MAEAVAEEEHRVDVVERERRGVSVVAGLRVGLGYPVLTIVVAVSLLLGLRVCELAAMGGVEPVHVG